MKAAHDICFIGLKCYDLIVKAKSPRFFGGAEKQMVSLAQGLSKKGLSVSFVTYDYGQPDKENVNGITVYKSFRPDEGLPIIRLFYPRTLKLWAALRRAKARIYVQMGAESETGQVALFCRWFRNSKSPFVFLVASDGDCMKRSPLISDMHERLLYYFGIHSADLIVSQTCKQQSMIRELFALNSIMVPMPYDGLPSRKLGGARVATLNSPHVIWVGRITKIKRVEWLLSIARMCPEFKFDVVGDTTLDPEYSGRMRQMAARVPNVTFHGKVSDIELAALYNQAAILCCTSMIEGFPTTFIEAWSYGLPVVSTFDPDGVIKREKLGFHAESLEGVTEGIKTLMNSPEVWQKISSRARIYYLKNHHPEKALERFEEIFYTLIGGK